MTKYLLGIDGGGSKTDFLLCDFELNEIARRVSTRSNPNDVGIEAVKSLLCENIALLLEDGGINNTEVAAAFAGIAGLTSRDYAAQVTKTLSDMLPNAKCGALHDGINVLYGAFPYEDGVSIICGTGSSCFVKRGNELFRIGGYGSFDLIGNGYEIGRAGIAHALKTADGREKSGVLATLIAERVGNDFVAALDTLLLMSKDELATFAPLVFKAAENGDSAAMQIIADNMKYIASLITRAGDYFENEYGVALAGGVLKSSISLSMLKRFIPERAKLITSDRAPSFGAAAKAKSLL
ncbi:MAG: hypothetical protein J6Q72_03675 [Clostridia bacterium]|nr:hypothetical protein [Clostridia bacterium]